MQTVASLNYSTNLHFLQMVPNSHVQNQSLRLSNAALVN